MANSEIRVRLAETGVKQYEVAEEKSLILQIIDELSTKKETV